jgi:hypothetical protein
MTWLAPKPVGANSLEDMVYKADMVLRGKSSVGVFSMDIKTAAYQRNFRVVVWDDNREKKRTLVKILGPALWRGSGTLKVGSLVKFFDPRSNHVTVVSHSMLGDNWMGSHFTYIPQFTKGAFEEFRGGYGGKRLRERATGRRSGAPREALGAGSAAESTRSGRRRSRHSGRTRTRRRR